MSKIAIFASGAGSNALKIIEYFEHKPQDIVVDCIITNQQQAGIYEVAAQVGLPIFQFNNAQFNEGTEVLECLQQRKVEWVVLAGFLRKISPILLKSYPNQMFNLHPSLLPKFGGKGMYGKYVHQAVIDNEEAESGISIHLVNEEYDKGKILLQESCTIEKDETVESLSKKVQQLEHKFFPIAIAKEIEEQMKEQ